MLPLDFVSAGEFTIYSRRCIFLIAFLLHAAGSHVQMDFCCSYSPLRWVKKEATERHNDGKGFREVKEEKALGKRYKSALDK